MIVTQVTESSERARIRSCYQRVAPLYDVLDAPLEPVYARGRSLIGSASQGITLELGAGTGKNFAYYPLGARVIGLDLSWAMLSHARRRLRPPIRGLLIGDLGQLPLRNDSVDTITASFMCCVQTNPRPALREIRRVLRPCGRVVLMEYVLPRSGWLRRLMVVLEPVLRTIYGVTWRPDSATLLEAAGLQILDVRPVWQQLIVVMMAAKPTGDRRQS